MLGEVTGGSVSHPNVERIGRGDLRLTRESNAFFDVDRDLGIQALFATTMGLVLRPQPFAMEVLDLNPFRELALPANGDPAQFTGFVQYLFMLEFGSDHAKTSSFQSLSAIEVRF